MLCLFISISISKLKVNSWRHGWIENRINFYNDSTNEKTFLKNLFSSMKSLFIKNIEPFVKPIERNCEWILLRHRYYWKKIFIIIKVLKQFHNYLDYFRRYSELFSQNIVPKIETITYNTRKVSVISFIIIKVNFFFIRKMIWIQSNISCSHRTVRRDTIFGPLLATAALQRRRRSKITLKKIFFDWNFRNNPKNEPIFREMSPNMNHFSTNFHIFFGPTIRYLTQR